VILTWSLPLLVGLPTTRLRMRSKGRMRGTRRFGSQTTTNRCPSPILHLFITASVSTSVRRRSVVSDTPTQSFGPSFGFSFLINHLR
jgi:hypothetical protein